MSLLGELASISSGWYPEAQHGFVHVGGYCTLPAGHAIKTSGVCGEGKGGKSSAWQFAWAEANESIFTGTYVKDLPKAFFELEENVPKGGLDNAAIGMLIRLNLPTIELELGE